MKQSFTASLTKEGEWFIAQCLEVDVASQGETEQQAIDHLRDALELHFEPPVAAISPTVRAFEIDIDAA